VGFSVKNMTNMYHLLLHSEEEHAHAQGGSDNGSGVRRMDAMLMRIVDSSEGGGDMIGGGVEAQVFATRPERHSFHVVLKAYTDMVERSCTFKELKLRADLMEEIVKIMEHKSGVGGNGVTPSVRTKDALLLLLLLSRLIQRHRLSLAPFFLQPLSPSIPPFRFSTFKATLKHSLATATASFLFSNECARMRAYLRRIVSYIYPSISALIQALVPTSPNHPPHAKHTAARNHTTYLMTNLLCQSEPITGNGTLPPPEENEPLPNGYHDPPLVSPARSTFFARCCPVSPSPVRRSALSPRSSNLPPRNDARFTRSYSCLCSCGMRISLLGMGRWMPWIIWMR